MIKRGKSSFGSARRHAAVAGSILHQVILNDDADDRVDDYDRRLTTDASPWHKVICRMTG